MKSRKVIGLISTAVILTILYLIFSLLSTMRPEVSLDDLLVAHPSFPTKWNSGEIPVNVARWQQTAKSDSAPIVSQAPAADRAWSGDGSLRISETVLHFSNPVQSYWNFVLHRPETIRFGDWPNFTYGCKDCYLHNWNYQNSQADQEHVVCAMGGENSCQVFYYWARYGQYIVLVELFAPNQGADNKTLEAVVNVVDQWIHTKLN